MSNRKCWVKNCQGPSGKWGMCEPHQVRWAAEHPPKGTALHKDLKEKFHFYVEQDTSSCANWGSERRDCWHWGGALSDHGYGLLAVPSKDWGDKGTTRMVRAHRLSYEFIFGPIPEDHEVDHLCRLRPCVNPFHLEVVTHQENNLRGTSPAAMHAAKTACPQGHEYDGVSDSGARTCSKCIDMHSLSRATGVGKGGYQTTRTHCPEGHPYEGENLIIEKRKKRDGSYGEVRKCRTCVAAVRAVRNARKRATS